MNQISHISVSSRQYQEYLDPSPIAVVPPFNPSAKGARYPLDSNSPPYKFQKKKSSSYKASSIIGSNVNFLLKWKKETFRVPVQVARELSHRGIKREPCHPPPSESNIWRIRNINSACRQHFRAKNIKNDQNKGSSLIVLSKELNYGKIGDRDSWRALPSPARFQDLTGDAPGNPTSREGNCPSWGIGPFHPRLFRAILIGIRCSNNEFLCHSENIQNLRTIFEKLVSRVVFFLLYKYFTQNALDLSNFYGKRLMISTDLGLFG